MKERKREKKSDENKRVEVSAAEPTSHKESIGKGIKNKKVPNIYEKLAILEKGSSSSVKKEEAEFIYSFLKEKRIKKTLEIGFSYGMSTAYIISATHYDHYVIDPFEDRSDNSGLKNIRKLKLNEYLKFENDFAHNSLPKLLKKGVKIDFAFIDGGHKFDDIFVDFYYVDLLLNINGYVLFHDTWMRSTQMVASWIKKNKTNYELVKTPLKNLIMFQKNGQDIRQWNHFKGFYTWKPAIKHRFFLLKNQYSEKKYENVPQDQKEQVMEFQANHPHKVLNIDGTCWRYISCGQGNKTLLFLPEEFVTADMWFYLILALEKDYRIIAPDAFTLSGTLAMDDVCGAILRILEAEEVEKTTIIGISAGGGVAQYFIQEYPHKVEHLVLSHCGIINAEKGLRLQKLLKLIKILPFPIIRWMVMRKSSGNYHSSSDWVEFDRAYSRKLISNVQKEAFVHFLEDEMETHRSFVFKPEVLQSGPGEILILSSKDDKLSIASMEELKARYPRAKVHVFEQGGHHTFLLFPEEYSSVIRDFLKEE